MCAHVCVYICALACVVPAFNVLCINFWCVKTFATNFKTTILKLSCAPIEINKLLLHAVVYEVFKYKFLFKLKISESPWISEILFGRAWDKKSSPMEMGPGMDKKSSPMEMGPEMGFDLNSRNGNEYSTPRSEVTRSPDVHLWFE